MAQGKQPRPQQDEGSWIESGQDHGKPVRYKIRPIPLDVDRRLHREAYRNAKVRRIGNESTSTIKERFEEYTFLRAGYALVDTENFAIDCGDVTAAEQYAKQTGGSVQFETEVLLDGKWTDELKAEVLRIVRKRAAWIASKAEKIIEAEVESEEEDAEDF